MPNRMRKLERALQEFRKLNPELNLQTALLFLLVGGSEEPLRVTDLANKLDVSLASASRMVASLGRLNRWHEEGLMLMDTREDVNDRRNKVAYLLPKGRLVYESLLDIMGEHA